MGKRKTTEEFKKELELKNSKVIIIGEYVNYKTKIKCKCPKCGNEWEGNPQTLMGGSGCPKCSHFHSGNTGKRKTKEEFIKEAQLLYRDTYDYNNIDYINNKTPISIYCNIHNIAFKQIPQNHLRGFCGCPKCSEEKNNYKWNKTTEDFVKKAKKIHRDKYDYSLVDYKNIETPVIIICPEHGKFEQRPTNHIKGAGCSKCNGGVKLTQEEWIQKAKSIHGDKYDYSKVNYVNSKTKVEIICNIHKESFYQLPTDHINKHCGCPKCSKSHGESIIEQYLIKNNIKYIGQYSIEIPKEINSSGKGYIDFYLPDYNCFIEYNGKQHYKPVKQFGGEIIFEHQQLRDNYIREYCYKNNIHLIEIPYTRSNDKTICQIKEYIESYE